MGRWHKIVDGATHCWNDDGYFYCRDFEHFYISTHREKGVWVTKLVEQCGNINTEKTGKTAKTLEKAKANAERLALTSLQKLAKSLNRDLKSL